MKRQTITSKKSTVRKKIVEKFFASLMEPDEALKLFAPDCKQYNPYVKGGMDALMKSMEEARVSMGSEFPDPEFIIKAILIDGNLAAAHTELLAQKGKPNKGGLRQVHLFQFGPQNKIVKYWDITQLITSAMPYPANAF
jgi:predicted SnoaL-like aldol condensation-catalyzing enzyme